MDLQAPLITAALAGFLLVFQQFLMMSVGTRRITTQVGVGYKDDVVLERLIRRHGNLAENSAIFLFVLGLIEVLGAATTLVTVFAVVFVVARLAHALGFTSLAGSHGGDYAKDGGKIFIGLRVLGAMSTAFVGFAAGGYLLVMALGLLSP
jgi:uncharacterized membrane protein YecN with MAPEG domain